MLKHNFKLITSLLVSVASVYSADAPAGGAGAAASGGGSSTGTVAATVSVGRGPVMAGILNDGATFATKEDAAEAIRRGMEDVRNPFVGNVCQLFHSTKHGMTEATITQIAPNIFLSCRHTAEELTAASTFFSKRGMKGFLLGVRAGSDILGGVKDIEIVPHPEVDVALLKLVFNEGEIPACDFLSIAKSVATEDKGSGFAVSYSDASIAGKEGHSKHTRALSIHHFVREGDDFVSSLSGEVTEIQAVDLIVAYASNNVERIKEIVSTATLMFPETTAVSSLRLMSVLRAGASGSPLVVKQGDTFKILGMLTKGAFRPKPFASPSAGPVEVNKELMKKVIYKNNFLDLTPYQVWIQANVAKLMKSK